MGHAEAYKIGEAICVLTALGIFFGIFFIFPIFALIKAISTRRVGWIITASISNLPLLFIVVCLCIGVVKGFKKGLSNSHAIAAARRGVSSPLLTADMTPISGNVLPYEISLPQSDSWQKEYPKPPFDHVFSYQDAYVGVIAEGVGGLTPENVCEFAQNNLKRKADQCSFTPTQPIAIGTNYWLTYDATATIHGVNVKYRFYVYGDPNYSMQIITWTGPVLFDYDAPVFDRIAKSFQMPQ